METTSKSTHPLILVAATSVTIASLAAAAYFTGLLPSHTAEPAPAPTAALSAPAVAQTTPAPQAKSEVPAPETSPPAARPHAQHRPGQSAPPARHAEPQPARDMRRNDGRYEEGTHRVSTNNAGIDVISSSQPETPAPPPAAPPPICRECGTVESIHEIATQGEGTGLGAVAGGVLGGILGHQVGRGSGKDLATIAGAVGGAVAGHQVEKNVRTGKQFQVTVRFDDGSVRSFTQTNPTWRNGDRVRLANGGLAPIGYPER